MVLTFYDIKYEDNTKTKGSLVFPNNYELSIIKLSPNLYTYEVALFYHFDKKNKYMLDISKTTQNVSPELSFEQVNRFIKDIQKENMQLINYFD